MLCDGWGLVVRFCCLFDVYVCFEDFGCLHLLVAYGCIYVSFAFDGLCFDVFYFDCGLWVLFGFRFIV